MKIRERHKDMRGITETKTWLKEEDAVEMILCYCLTLGFNAVWSFEIQQKFRKNMSFRTSRSKNKRSKSPWRWRPHASPKRRLIFIDLHEVISQKIEIFITTAVRTSNPTKSNICYSLYLLTAKELTLSIKQHDICEQKNVVSDFHVRLIHHACLKTLLVFRGL
jgi:hypothetical protein